MKNKNILQFSADGEHWHDFPFTRMIRVSNDGGKTFETKEWTTDIVVDFDTLKRAVKLEIERRKQLK